MIFFQLCHIRVLGSHVVGIFFHMDHEVHVGTIEVSHCCVVLCCLLSKVGKLLLYPDQVVVSVTALVQCFLLLLEIGLGFYEVVPEGCLGYVLLCPPRLKIFRVLSHFCDKSVCNTDDLGICDRLTHCCCKVGALVDSLDETSKWLLCIVSGADLLIICRYVRYRYAGIMSVEVIDQIDGRFCGVSCVHVL